MHEALFYQRMGDGRVTCGLCHHQCQIRPGRRGLCGVRENRDGVLVSLVYGELVAEHVDPIEKKPLLHFLPTSRAYSISTVGCNFFCRHCQNSDISQFSHASSNEIPGVMRRPDQVVAEALRLHCASVCYTYVEPTIFFEFALDCAVLARKEGLKNVFVSNGYMMPEVTRQLSGVLDGINIDIKAFTDDFYQQVCKAHLQPVLENVRLFHELGVWVEVTTLLIPGLNDSEDELRQLARFIHSVSPTMPWHVTAFYPTYKMTDRPPTPVASLRRAREIGLEEGLSFVYEGNIPGGGGEDTSCPDCGKTLIRRHGFQVQENRLKKACCGGCGRQIAGVWC